MNLQNTTLNLNTDRGVIADVVIIPDSNTGLAKLAYVVDLGGNIYRITIGTNSPSNWAITKIASLGCSNAGRFDSRRGPACARGMEASFTLG